MNQRYEVQLTEKIRKRFDEDELKELCFRLDISYENLEGSTPFAKTRSLVWLCNQTDLLPKLVRECVEMRPNEAWREPQGNSEPQPDPKPQSELPITPWYSRFSGWVWVGGVFLGVLVVLILFLILKLAGGGGSDRLTATPTITSMPTISPTPEPGIGSTRIRPADGAVMVYVPEGEFVMGSDEGEYDEKPRHTVYLNGYWLDQTEVTNAMYVKCERADVCERPLEISSFTRDNYYLNPVYADYPVIFVSWENARTYCEWANGRLPTEAEWEKAARWDEEAQEVRTYPWGEGIDCDLANYGPGDFCVGDTTAVGSYPAGVSPYGALDMVGNVWEWVADWYNGNYYAELVYDNPTGPPTGDFRARRGGSWYYHDKIVRAANRDLNYDPANGGNVNAGFRCAQE